MSKQRFAVAVIRTLMKQPPDLSVEILAGERLSEIACRPLPPYSICATDFLEELSRALLANPAIRLYPDIAAFAFWCRRANLNKLAREFNDVGNRIGRGLVFHIAPANVPVNFAFSFAFGLLAGNANIVRIPGAVYPQVEIVCEEIGRLFAEPKHRRVASMNSLIRYPRNDEMTAALSAVCHARMLWGGDGTISHLRAMRTSPRCVDVAFADRYSLCVMAAAAVLDAKDDDVRGLTEGFYNDVFLLDQNACSSPHLVLWLGEPDQAEAAMARFWKAMKNLLDSKGAVQPIHAIEKFTNLCRAAVGLDEISAATRHGNQIYRVRLSALPGNIDTHRGRHGFFFEYVCDGYDCMKSIVGERYQTLTCFGVDRKSLIQFIVDEGLTGIDRVVAVGRALDIGVIWDGYDLIGTLSRVISER